MAVAVTQQSLVSAGEGAAPSQTHFQFGLRRSLREKGRTPSQTHFQFGLRRSLWKKGQDTISNAEVFLPLLPTVRNDKVQHAAALIPTFLGSPKYASCTFWFAALHRRAAKRDFILKTASQGMRRIVAAGNFSFFRTPVWERRREYFGA